MKKITLLIAFLVSIKSYSQCWQNISAGDNHILAVKNDWTLWAWGSNNYGKCGPSFQNYTNTPTQVGSENNWLKASPAIYHSMTIKTNGDLYGWGYNYYGNIGVGTSGNNNAIIPFSVHIGNSTWTSIACGNDFTIAINSNGLWDEFTCSINITNKSGAITSSKGKEFTTTTFSILKKLD